MCMKGGGCTTSRILSTIHRPVPTFGRNSIARNTGALISFTSNTGGSPMTVTCQGTITITLLFIIPDYSFFFGSRVSY